jgi:MYXO-CTERM domain-containing protein
VPPDAGSVLPGDFDAGGLDPGDEPDAGKTGKRPDAGTPGTSGTGGCSCSAASAAPLALLWPLALLLARRRRTR